METALVVIGWAVGCVILLGVTRWLIRIGGADSSWFKGGGSGSL